MLRTATMLSIIFDKRKYRYQLRLIIKLFSFTQSINNDTFERYSLILHEAFVAFVVILKSHKPLAYIYFFDSSSLGCVCFIYLYDYNTC